MNIFHRRRKQVQSTTKKDRNSGRTQQGAPTDENGRFVEEKSEAIQQQIDEQEASLSSQQERRNQEINDLDAEVDKILSQDPEEFMKKLKQPGGE